MWLAGCGWLTVAGWRDTPLTDAVHDRHFDVMRQLVGAGADVDHAAWAGDDDCGNTALQKAARKSDVDMLHFLCDLGADINKPDESGHTLLAASVWAGGDGLATRMLLAARADVDRCPSPLALAMLREDRACTQLLLEAGAAQAKACAGRGGSR